MYSYHYNDNYAEFREVASKLITAHADLVCLDICQ